MRRTPPATALALQQQAARDELAQIHAAILASRGELEGLGNLRAINEHLVCSAMDAARVAEECTRSLAEASRAAERDTLTGLPNRTVLLDRLVHAMAHARCVGESLGVLFVDLDDFKRINDEFGHAVGDDVLKLMATRLGAAVRGEDTVSRHGGDEFLILLNGVANAASALSIADKVLAAVARPCALPGRTLVLGASIGVSLFPDDGEDAGVLIARADSAMYRAKRRGLGRCAAGDWTEAAPTRRGPAFEAEPAAATGSVQVADGAVHGLLRDANEQLVLAALGSQASQVAAENAHRMQREHFAVVVHELRGPLSPIRMAAGLLARLPATELPRVAGIIDREVMHMARLIGDLLDLSRVHTGKLRLERCPVRLDALIHDAVEASREARAERSQVFTQTLETGELEMYADPMRLAQVLRNLLDNASKYTPEGGSISLETARVGATVAITISDSGIGITPAALPHVFDPFSQDPHAVGFNAGGLGIGLAVVRELVEAHGGTVLACSDGPGRGSCFVVTLTLSHGRAGEHGPGDLGPD